jgi:hypothetical protein
MRAMNYAQRKKALAHGKLTELGKELAEDRRFMSSVMRNDAGRYAPHRVHAAQRAIAHELGLPISHVFGKKALR